MISDRVPPGGKGGGKVSLQEEKGGRDFMTRPISHFFERRPPKKGKIVGGKGKFSLVDHRGESPLASRRTVKNSNNLWPASDLLPR